MRGQSREDRPVYAIRLTDPNTSDKHKENVFISALHSGGERTGTATVFYLMEWMLSGDPLAAEILRTQNIICMPVPNPDDYLRGDLGYVYSEWNLKGPKDPEHMPEGMAVKEVMDELQPDVHADIHGLTMNFTKYIMLENSGSSYSNLGLRCYHHEIIRQMDAAALAEGYPSDRQESDSERIYWGPELEEMSARSGSGVLVFLRPPIVTTCSTQFSRPWRSVGSAAVSCVTGACWRSVTNCGRVNTIPATRIG